MNSKTRQVCIGIGSMCGAGFVHSLLPTGNIWMRAGLTGGAAMVIFLLLMWLVPQPTK